MKTAMPLTALSALALMVQPVLGDAVIYEPFDDSDLSLRSNATGDGLTGTWGGDSRPDIVGGSLGFGNVQTSGNAVSADGAWFANNALIDTADSDYTDLLTPGGDMWFSMMYRKDSGNGRFYFTIGNSGVVNNGNLVSSGDVNNPNQAIGFGSTGSRVYAGLWENFDWGNNNLSNPGATSVDVTNDSLVNSDDGGTLLGQTTYLIVGHAQWGAGANDNDTVTLYLPDTSLNLGDPVARSVGVVDQSEFDRINTNHGNNVVSRWDEIRIGASFEDVAPVPEPGSLALLGLGGLLMAKRRRK